MESAQKISDVQNMILGILKNDLPGIVDKIEELSKDTYTKERVKELAKTLGGVRDKAINDLTEKYIKICGTVNQ